MGLRANTHVAKATKQCFKNVENAFWGERIRGSLNNSGGFNCLAKGLNAEKRDKKVQPGVVYAVITSNNNLREVMVSRNSFHSIYHLEINLSIMAILCLFLHFLGN